MDAGRYKKHYAKMTARSGSNGAPSSKEREYVQELWDRLVDAYIRPSGSREVNLPGQVRDAILNLSPGELPPAPEALDPAVAKTYELMEDSVLVPFLNSVYPQTAHPMVSSMPPQRSAESLSMSPSGSDSRSSRSRNRYSARSSPPPQTAVEPHAYSYTPPSMFNRNSAPTSFNTMNKARFSTKLSQTTSNPIAETDTIASGSGTDGSGPGMTDDSGSADSPSYESPTTPPSSPPIGESQYAKRDSGMWKKLGRLSGMKAAKKKSQGGLREED